MSIRFEWDERKSRLNQEKHGVSFEEASSAFYDENGLVIADPDHSEIEERFILLGMSLRLRVLTVCHCFRSDDQTVRIISARKATRRESLQYRNSL
ncbi:MAG: BrnT family toxin [Desulforhabdus sp.]|jgi:uncharacterized DUF497 family protein|nr:BrnT family toxin [Desulforhabdus sp.]